MDRMTSSERVHVIPLNNKLTTLPSRTRSSKSKSVLVTLRKPHPQYDGSTVVIGAQILEIPSIYIPYKLINSRTQFIFETSVESEKFDI